MSAGKMHADEFDTDASLVRRLLEAQFPQWAALPIEPVALGLSTDDHRSILRRHAPDEGDP